MVEPLACVLRGIHETGIEPGDTTIVIGCGPIGLNFIRVLSGRGRERDRAWQEAESGARRGEIRRSSGLYSARLVGPCKNRSRSDRTRARGRFRDRGGWERRKRGNGRFRWSAAAAQSICLAAARGAP